jgi:DNA-binding CsgD family transcriptional regulator
MEQLIRERSAPSLTHARSLFLRGFYANAISELLVLPAEACQLLALVRVYLRVGKFDEAARCVVTARAGGYFDDPVAALQSSAMEIFAHASLGFKVESSYALALLEQAQRFTSLICEEVEYYAAGALFIAGHYDHAERITMRRFKLGLYDGNEFFLGRFHLLQCWLHSARGDYQSQASSLMNALSIFLQSPERDIGLCAITAQGLCVLARDIYLPEATNIVLEAEPFLEGPPDLALQRFQIPRLLGWAKAMHGDYIASIRHIAASARIAADPLCTFVSHLDQAWVARISKQDILADAALCDAAEYIDNHSVAAPLGEHAMAFTLAAELFATKDTGLAQKALDRAKQTQENLPRNAGYVHDERLTALIDFAEAVIREARGERRVACLRAKRAYEVFSPIGYVWRAGKCATLLYRLTGEEGWLTAAEDAAKAYPRSFLAADLARWREGGRAPQERLTARQREIFEMLRRGLTFVQIGETLGCSPNTVRVHTGRIYEVFGVPKNAGLQGLFRALSTSAA